MHIKADQHIHSHNSGDSKAPMEAMIDAAISLGMDYLCFTEHEDMDFPDSPGGKSGSIFLVDADAYLEEFRSVKAAYEGKIRLGFGIELGLQPGVVSKNREFLDSYPFEFVIGSNHIVNRKDPYYPAYYEGRPAEEAFREFFISTLENLRLFDDIDVLGHLDYIARYCPDKNAYDPASYFDITDEIMKLLIDKGIGLDVNTSPLYKGFTQPNPCRALLERYHMLGGELITLGSDAHVPEAVGSHFEDVKDLLTDIGFKHYFVYKGRRDNLAIPLN